MDVNSLETELAASAGPNHRDGRALENQNAHWSNQAQHWSHHFAPRAAAGIAKEVDKAVASLAKSAGTVGEQVETALNAFANEVATAGTKLLTSAVRHTAQKTDLLWWKEALYSPTLCCSYRDLNPSEAVISMSQDLYEIVSSPSPQSVEYFMRETVRAVLAENPEISIEDLLQAAQESDRIKRVVKAVTPPNEPKRVSLQEALSYAGQFAFKSKKLQPWLGVAGDLKVRADSLAVWLFRDKQALALISKASGK